MCMLAGRRPAAALTTSPNPHKVRMTLWSLTSRSVAYVPHPKACEVSFTSDGSFLAVVERKVSPTEPRNGSPETLLSTPHRRLPTRNASIISPSFPMPLVGS
jgi:hypothetical protein